MNFRHVMLCVNVVCLGVCMVMTFTGPPAAAPLFALGAFTNGLALVLYLRASTTPKVKTRLQEWKEKCKRD